MSRRDMIEILEISLGRIAAGSTVETVVADYPDQAEELRGLLEMALEAQPAAESTRVPARAQANSRKRMLAKAEQLKSQPRPFDVWGGLRFLRQHAGSAVFVVAMLALMFIALGSVNALPGDGLFPVKLAAEQAGVSLSASDATRLEREAGFDTRRAEEVARMIQEKRSGAVAFGGFLTNADAAGWQAAGIPLSFAPSLEQQAQGLAGAFVEIQGSLGAKGAVSVETIQPLLYSLSGAVQQIDANGWTVNDTIVRVTSFTQVTGNPRIGDKVVIQAARLSEENRLLAVTVKPAGEPETSPVVSPSVTAAPTQTPRVSPTPSPTAMPSATQQMLQPQPTQMPTQVHDDDHKTPEAEDGDHDSGDDHNSGGSGGSDDDNSGSSGGSGDDSGGDDHDNSGSSGDDNSGKGNSGGD